ncbi:hypothetical protein U1Q18_004567 [Sarracenia purpurea var. burkii]
MIDRTTFCAPNLKSRPLLFFDVAFPYPELEVKDRNLGPDLDFRPLLFFAVASPYPELEVEDRNLGPDLDFGLG